MFARHLLLAMVREKARALTKLNAYAKVRLSQKVLHYEISEKVINYF